MTRRRRPGSPGGLAVAGRQLFAASFGRKSYGAAAAAHGTPVTGRLRSPPYPAAAPASTTARASTSCRKRAGRREKVTADGPERRALSGSAPPASTVLRIPLRGTRLRRR